MKITDNRSGKTFADLKDGDVFIDNETGDICMKIYPLDREVTSYNVVVLSTGGMYCYEDEFGITKLNANLIIED